MARFADWKPHSCVSCHNNLRREKMWNIVQMESEASIPTLHPPNTHTDVNIHKHTQKAIMLRMVRRICDWLLCVFTGCLSLLSPLLSVSTITPSLRVSFSLSFFAVISLSHTKKEKMGWGFCSYLISYAYTGTDKPTW